MLHPRHGTRCYPRALLHSPSSSVYEPQNAGFCNPPPSLGSRSRNRGSHRARQRWRCSYPHRGAFLDRGENKRDEPKPILCIYLGNASGVRHCMLALLFVFCCSLYILRSLHFGGEGGGVSPGADEQLWMHK